MEDLKGVMAVDVACFSGKTIISFRSGVLQIFYKVHFS